MTKPKTLTLYFPDDDALNMFVWLAGDAIREQTVLRDVAETPADNYILYAIDDDGGLSWGDPSKTIDGTSISLDDVLISKTDGPPRFVTVDHEGGANFFAAFGKAEEHVKTWGGDIYDIPELVTDDYDEEEE